MVKFISREDIDNLEPNKIAWRGAYKDSETKRIAGMVGYELPAENRNYYAAMEYTNLNSNLGLNEKECEIMGRLLTALGLGTRFAGVETIELQHGENSSVHSLQMVNLLEQTIYQTWNNLESYQKSDALQELLPIRQYAALSILMHDMGEILGECSFPFHDGLRFEEGLNKTILEQRILEQAMKVAIASVEANESREDFLQRFITMREVLPIDEMTAKNETLTKQHFDAALSNEAFQVPELSQEGELFFNQMMAIFQMSEYAGKDIENKFAKIEGVQYPENADFTGKLVKAIDGLQGIKQLTRFGIESITTDEGKQKLHQITDAQIADNFGYLERNLATLYDFSESDVEKRIAWVQRNAAYGASINLIQKVCDPKPKIAEEPERSKDIAEEYLPKQSALIAAYESASLQPYDEAPLIGIGAKILEKQDYSTPQQPFSLTSSIKDDGVVSPKQLSFKLAC